MCVSLRKVALLPDTSTLHRWLHAARLRCTNPTTQVEELTTCSDSFPLLVAKERKEGREEGRAGGNIISTVLPT